MQKCGAKYIIRKVDVMRIILVKTCSECPYLNVFEDTNLKEQLYCTVTGDNISDPEKTIATSCTLEIMI